MHWFRSNTNLSLKTKDLKITIKIKGKKLASVKGLSKKSACYNMTISCAKEIRATLVKGKAQMKITLFENPLKLCKTSI